MKKSNETKSMTLKENPCSLDIGQISSNISRGNKTNAVTFMPLFSNEEATNLLKTGSDMFHYDIMQYGRDNFHDFALYDISESVVDMVDLSIMSKITHHKMTYRHLDIINITISEIISKIQNYCFDQMNCKEDFQAIVNTIANRLCSSGTSLLIDIENNFTEQDLAKYILSKAVKSDNTIDTTNINNINELIIHYSELDASLFNSKIKQIISKILITFGPTNNQDNYIILQDIYDIVDLCTIIYVRNRMGLLYEYWSSLMNALVATDSVNRNTIDKIQEDK